jgi:putative FmdB family regulatory protein
MPIYEYQCGKCDLEFEREQRITEDPVKTCPSCRSRKVKKLISQTSFVLKGGGWYSDLYSSAKDPKSEAKDDSGKSKETSEKSDKSDKSTDEKPAKKKADKKSPASETSSKKKSPKSAA